METWQKNRIYHFYFATCPQARLRRSGQHQQIADRLMPTGLSVQGPLGASREVPT